MNDDEYNETSRQQGEAMFLILAWMAPCFVVGFVFYEFTDSYRTGVIGGVVGFILCFFIKGFLSRLADWLAIALVVILAIGALFIAGWIFSVFWKSMPS